MLPKLKRESCIPTNISCSTNVMSNRYIIEIKNCPVLLRDVVPLELHVTRNKSSLWDNDRAWMSPFFSFLGFFISCFIKITIHLFVVLRDFLFAYLAICRYKFRR